MLIQNFMRAFFRLLYHPFAWAYDFVAAFVSFGQWKKWGQSITPFIHGTHILELGPGPGHLQRFLLNRGLVLFAVDESSQMLGLAKKRIGATHKLARGHAQALPYPSESFDSVISTFPTDYIFQSRTLSEIKRILRSDGRLIVLPVAFPRSGFLQWLYRVTGESPNSLSKSLQTKIAQPFINAGFQTEIKVIDVKSNQLLIVIANKQGK
ncbi:MAG: class I SAM-dependent methyltransferase [Anaerolineales bacterium]|nr:class I SAM-dependent methyltransferase [Anaerolineales bacterium]